MREEKLFTFYRKQRPAKKLRYWVTRLSASRIVRRYLQPMSQSTNTSIRYLHDSLKLSASANGCNLASFCTLLMDCERTSRLALTAHRLRTFYVLVRDKREKKEKRK